MAMCKQQGERVSLNSMVYTKSAHMKSRVRSEKSLSCLLRRPPTLVAGSNLGAMASNVLVTPQFLSFRRLNLCILLASNLVRASNPLAMASNLVALRSFEPYACHTSAGLQLVAMASTLDTMASNLLMFFWFLRSFT